MNDKIKEVIIDNDKVYMKKDFSGWRVIYPIKNTDGSWNMKNLILGGSWWNFLKIFIIFLLLMGATYIYHLDTQTCTNTLNHINEICAALKVNATNPYLVGIKPLIIENVTT